MTSSAQITTHKRLIPRYLIRIFAVVCLLANLSAHSNEWRPQHQAERNKATLFFPQAPVIHWLANPQNTLQAHDALDFIAAAAQQGLAPEKYRYTQLSQLLSGRHAQATRLFEQLLTDSLLQLIQDLATGQFNAQTADPDWAIPQKQFDAVDFLIHARYQKHFRQTLNTLIPDTRTQHILEQALAQYQSFHARGGWKPIPVTPLLRPGQTHDVIPLIRARLRFETPALLTATQDKDTFFDPMLAKAVKKFQARYGLKTDGIIGPETRREMNVSALDRVRQLKIALERRRWLPEITADRYLFINLANYTLTAMAHHRPVLSMRVIIGRKSRQTPSFTAAINHLVFNPYWHVPGKLARQDLLPRQQQDPTYFSQHHIRVFQRRDGRKVEISPYAVDWASLNRHHFPYILRQDPGEDNALGKVKFLFANPWGIYMHDTPHKTLFAETVRAFSSGCIRLEKPLELVKFVLPSLAASTIHQYVDSGHNTGLTVTPPLPVYAVYFTVWVKDGQLQFSPDIYQRDKRMTDLL